MVTARHKVFQAYKKAPWRFQLQLIGVFSLALVMVSTVAGIYLNVTARAATIGREIQDMQEIRFDQERINEDLATSLAELTSSAKMEERALELGFYQAQSYDINYIVVPGYSGRASIQLAPPPGPVASNLPDLPREYTQTLLEWFEEFSYQPEKTGPGAFLFQNIPDERQDLP